MTDEGGGKALCPHLVDLLTQVTRAVYALSFIKKPSVVEEELAALAQQYLIGDL